jgi:hypothetical protein
LSAAFDVLYANKAGKTPGGKTPVGSRFAAPWASEPSTLLMFTIRPAGERRSSGSTALVTPHDAEDVCLVGGSHLGDRRLARRHLGSGDTGAVHQDVEMADLVGKPLGRQGDRGVVGDIQSQQARTDAPRPQRLLGALSTGGVPDAEVNGPAQQTDSR